MRVRVGLTTLLVAALAATVSSCGDDDGSEYVFVPSGTGAPASGTPGQDAVTVLKDPALGKALVSLNDVGPGFAVNVNPDDDRAKGMGCLEPLGNLSRSNLSADASDQARYDAASQLAVPSVVTKIRSFSSVERATAMFEQIADAAKGCTSVSSTTDGFSIELGVSTDRKRSGPAADDQFTMTAMGAGTTNGVSFPFGTQLTAIRVRNNITLVAFTGVGFDLTTDANRVAGLALERLVSVTAGELPNPTPLNLHVTTQADLVP